VNKFAEIYGKAKAWFNGLKPRERQMVIAAAATAVVVALVFLVTSPGGKKSGPKQSKISQVNQRRQVFLETAAQYSEIKRLLDQLDVKVAQRAPEFDIYGKVNELSDSSGIKPTVVKMDPGESSGDEYLDENYVDLTLQRIDLVALTNFMSKVEKLPGLIRINQLTIKTRFDQSQTLDAVMRISSYKVKEGGAKLKEQPRPKPGPGGLLPGENR
jgi:Tfp pilus assembly protein PilO